MPFKDIQDYATMVKIILQQTGDTFTVHKELIETQSEFAKTCLNSGFKEGNDQVVKIGDWKDRKSMEMIVVWLYNGFGAVEQKLPATSNINSLKSDMVDLYLLADRLIMPRLKKHIVDKFRKHMPALTPDIEALKTLDAECPEPCQLKNLMVDDLAHRMSQLPKAKSIPTQQPSWFVAFAELVANEESVSILPLKAFVPSYGKSSEPFINTVTCYYHEHQKGEKKCDGSVAE